MSSISESFFLDKQKNPFILSLWLNNFSKYFRRSFLACAQVSTPKGHTLNRIPNQQGEETNNNVLVKSFASQQERKCTENSAMDSLCKFCVFQIVLLDPLAT